MTADRLTAIEARLAAAEARLAQLEGGLVARIPISDVPPSPYPGIVSPWPPATSCACPPEWCGAGSESYCPERDGVPGQSPESLTPP